MVWSLSIKISIRSLMVLKTSFKLLNNTGNGSSKDRALSVISKIVIDKVTDLKSFTIFDQNSLKLTFETV